MSDISVLLKRYLRQQCELGMPPYIFAAGAQAPVARALRGGAAPAWLGAAPAPVAPPALDAGPPAAQPRPVALGVHAAPAETPADARQRMAEIFRASRSCAACGLGATRTTFVFGAGSVRGPLMVIGEAPGAEEDRQGLPFVGAAGQLLTKMLAAVQLDREKDVFITNVLKCRPPQNRTPEAAEVAACIGMLRAQIDAMRPRALLLLGRVAAQAVLGCTGSSVAGLRARTHVVGGIPAVVTYHPAALLRKESLKREAWEDLQRLRNILDQGNHNGR